MPGVIFATEAVVEAPADGYTLLLTSVGNAVDVLTLYDKLVITFSTTSLPVLRELVVSHSQWK